MILEEYVEFETAKLLKEKGFNEMTDYWYDGETGEAHRRGNYSSSSMAHYDKDRDCNAPTQALAMRWLRETHNVHVVPKKDFFAGYYTGRVYDGRRETNMERDDYVAIAGYDTYEEACEAAIKYCLENLI